MITTKSPVVANFCKKENENFPRQIDLKTYSIKDFEEWLCNGADFIIALLTIHIQFERVNEKYEYHENRKKSKTRAFTQIRLITEF